MLRGSLCHTFLVLILIYTDSECGKREAHKKWGMVVPERAAPVTQTFLRDYWPSAGGLSAVNAMGTQLLDPINSGLIRWRLTVYMDAVAKSEGNPVNKISPDLAWAWRLSGLTRDGTVEPVS